MLVLRKDKYVVGDISNLVPNMDVNFLIDMYKKKPDTIIKYNAVDIVIFETKKSSGWFLLDDGELFVGSGYIAVIPFSACCKIKLSLENYDLFRVLEENEDLCCSKDKNSLKFGSMVINTNNIKKLDFKIEKDINVEGEYLKFQLAALKKSSENLNVVGINIIENNIIKKIVFLSLFSLVVTLSFLYAYINFVDNSFLNSMLLNISSFLVF